MKEFPPRLTVFPALDDTGHPIRHQAADHNIH
jgi:hypothetical protein